MLVINIIVRKGKRAEKFFSRAKARDDYIHVYNLHVGIDEIIHRHNPYRYINVQYPVIKLDRIEIHLYFNEVGCHRNFIV